MAAAAIACLTGCWTWSAPVGEPGTPEPVETSATPWEPERLDLLAQSCGTDDAEPSGDVAFTGGATRPQALLPDGMTLPLGLRVDLASDHGKHSVDLERLSGFLVDGSGIVVGLVTGTATPPGGGTSGPSAAYSAPIVVSLGACPADGVELADPVPDGDYSLVLSGPVSPVDHDHGQQEYWLAPPVPLTVGGGAIAPA